MTRPRRDTKKKPRITEQQIDDIKRLFMEGVPISEIAIEVGAHRHTVSAYIASKHIDIVADEARKQVLTAGLEKHFKELAAFARQDIRKRYNASAPGAIHTTAKISTSGVMALPHLGSTSHYVTTEWARMYDTSPRDQHLLRSLREHTTKFRLWAHWDRWRKQVASFENASQALWAWLERKIEDKPPDDVQDSGIVRSWIFGNIMRIAGGREPEGIETLMQHAWTEGTSPTVHSNPSAVSEYALQNLEEARNWPELDTLRSAMAELAGGENQPELRRLADQIDFELAGVELMESFGASCHLCPT